MSDSILNSVKKCLNIASTDPSFDEDVLMHINSVLSTVCQLGIGPSEGFTVTDATSTWTTFLGADSRYNFVKSYVFLRVRVIFDPPTSSHLGTALVEQFKEFEFRMSVMRESTGWVDPTVPVT